MLFFRQNNIVKKIVCKILVKETSWFCSLTNFFRNHFYFFSDDFSARVFLQLFFVAKVFFIIFFSLIQFIFEWYNFVRCGVCVCDTNFFLFYFLFPVSALHSLSYIRTHPIHTQTYNNFPPFHFLSVQQHQPGPKIRVII